jgi:Trk K+ transport system NAD-binding subunit
MRVVALYRNDTEVSVDAQTRVLPGDEVFVLADKEKIRFACWRPSTAWKSRCAAS